MMSKVWNISVGQPGYLPACAPSQLLHTCPLAECEKLEKVLYFRATAENHQCHQRSSPVKSKTQQLLGGKLTLIPAKTRRT